MVIGLSEAAAQAAAEPDLRTAPAVLVLIGDRGCPYCARWERDVAEGYVKSDEGRFAPLVRRLRGAPDVAFIPNVIYSPTFVVLVHGKEVGRIVGYQGADLFWTEIAVLLGRAGFRRTGMRIAAGSIG